MHVYPYPRRPPKKRRSAKKPSTGRTRVVAYTRVSTDHQAEEGVSLAAQAERLRAYALATDLELIEIVEDAGLSGATLERPGLRRALDLLASGRADALAVVSLSRLTRSVRDLGALVDEHFGEGRGSLISLGESIDTRSASGRLVLHVLGAVSAWERESTAERTSAALRFKRARGEYVGGHAPVGYRLDGARLVADAAEQRLIARARELRGDGLSLRAVASTLEAEGHRTRTGRALDFVRVQRVLRSAEVSQPARDREVA
jgi:site-specific DNA recombinase